MDRAVFDGRDGSRGGGGGGRDFTRRGDAAARASAGLRWSLPSGSHLNSNDVAAEKLGDENIVVTVPEEGTLIIG